MNDNTVSYLLSSSVIPILVLGLVTLTNSSSALTEAVKNSSVSGTASFIILNRAVAIGCVGCRVYVFITPV